MYELKSDRLGSPWSRTISYQYIGKALSATLCFLLRSNSAALPPLCCMPPDFLSPRVASWVDYSKQRTESCPVDTTPAILVCWRLMYYDVENIAVLVIRTQNLWIRHHTPRSLSLSLSLSVGHYASPFDTTVCSAVSAEDTNFAGFDYIYCHFINVLSCVPISLRRRHPQISSETALREKVNSDLDLK